MAGCESILGVTGGWFISVCVCVCANFFYVVLEAESAMYGGF